MSEFAGSVIDHVGIGVSDILHARAFYERALEPLGITLMMSIEADPPQLTPRRLGFGSAGSRSYGCTTLPSLATGPTLR